MEQDNKETSINSGTKADPSQDPGVALKQASEGNNSDPLSDLKQKLEESEKKYLYLYSDFENFRRRTETERLNYIKYGHESFLRELLQVLDNFERGIQHAKTFNAEKSSPLGQMLFGLEMIYSQFVEALKSQGLVEVKTAGEKFNPAFHEAVSEEVSTTVETNTILKEHTRGYLLHGRLLRAARVVTAKKADAPTADSANN